MHAEVNGKKYYESRSTQAVPDSDMRLMWEKSGSQAWQMATNHSRLGTDLESIGIGMDWTLNYRALFTFMYVNRIRLGHIARHICLHIRLGHISRHTPTYMPSSNAWGAGFNLWFEPLKSDHTGLSVFTKTKWILIVDIFEKKKVNRPISSVYLSVLPVYRLFFLVYQRSFKWKLNGFLGLSLVFFVLPIGVSDFRYYKFFQKI